MFDQIISTPSYLTSIGTNEMLFDLKENFVSPRLKSLLIHVRCRSANRLFSR